MTESSLSQSALDGGLAQTESHGQAESPPQGGTPAPWRRTEGRLIAGKTESWSSGERETCGREERGA